MTGPGEDQFPTEGLRWGSLPSPSSNLTCLLSPSCKLTQLPMSGETAKRAPVGAGQKPKVHTHPQEGPEGAGPGLEEDPGEILLEQGGSRNKSWETEPPASALHSCGPRAKLFHSINLFTHKVMGLGWSLPSLWPSVFFYSNRDIILEKCKVRRSPVRAQKAK